MKEQHEFWYEFVKSSIRNAMMSRNFSKYLECQLQPSDAKGPLDSICSLLLYRITVAANSAGGRAEAGVMGKWCCLLEIFFSVNSVLR